MGRVFLVLVMLAGLIGPSLAAERVLVPLVASDLPGGDYRISKKSSSEGCAALCVKDAICDGYTFNTKTRWCFLKSGDLKNVPFVNAISGRVEEHPTRTERMAQREGELPFPARELIEAARVLVKAIADAPPPETLAYDDLVANGDNMAADGNAAAAETSYRQALALNPNDPAIWTRLADAIVAGGATTEPGSAESYQAGYDGSSAAINAFLRSETPEQSAIALAVLGDALGLRTMWPEAIATYRASLALQDDPGLAERLAQTVAEHGFRISGHVVDAEAADPRICVQFSDPLPTDGTDFSTFVTVEGAPQAAVESDSQQVCVRGLEHGERYRLTVRAGLPSATGEKLLGDARLDIYVPDRAPFVGFVGDAYVMPKSLKGGLPITSVNADTAKIALYRVGDRSLATAVRTGMFLNRLNGYSAGDLAANQGEKLFEGEVTLSRGETNALVTTAIPVDQVIGAVAPGAYVITARPTNQRSEDWQDLATQWFIVTDLGLTGLSGTDGFTAYVRSLGTARPLGDVAVRLVAVNNEVLGEGRTNSAGRFHFDPGLMRGTGGRAPQLLVAETGEGDYAFIDISRAAFDLSDRGVTGRPAPGPIDVYATTERGVYRPGETVYLTALVRDARARAIAGMPLTLTLERPDGVLDRSEVLNDQGAGGYFAALPLNAGAQRGSWTLRLRTGSEGPPLAVVTLLVEDFEPERLAVEASAPEGALPTSAALPVSVRARYLYGAPAPDLAVEADLLLKPVSTRKDWPGYLFGRKDDGFEPDLRPLGTLATTAADGSATIDIAPPDLPQTTRLLDAQLILRVVEASGRIVERRLTRPVPIDGVRLGVKPRFDLATGAPQGGEAGFDVLSLGGGGTPVASSGLTWRLSRLSTTYQWYRAADQWRWEPVTSTELVASGDLQTGPDGKASIAAPVDWGRYRLELDGAGTSASLEFDAGFVYATAGADTPDTLRVALDKTSYRIGETAHLRLEPQFAGEALVTVMDDRLIYEQAVTVPADGLTVDLPVTEEWGAGAYVSATLFRPADSGMSRMPSRALGLDYADVDAGSKVLPVTLSAPETARPGSTLEVGVALPPGTDVHVAVAAVDLGILNLTRFADWDPDSWYFGQRQLGLEIRDLYGRLIDPTQGTPGAIRSGGDGGGARLIGAPPPTTVLVAQHSGIVTAGPDGKAVVRFDLPDFSGTVRILAMAWTDNAVGHARTDVTVRDPVVATLTPPRFLRVGDTAELLVELDNVAGPAGDYALSLTGGTGVQLGETPAKVPLGAGDRAVLRIPLTGSAVADADIALTLTAPDGTPTLKHVALGVRPIAGAVRRVETLVLDPGTDLILGPDRLAGLLAGTGTVAVTVGPLAALHAGEVALALDRYPYGCAEQIVSRAMPLLVLPQIADLLGLPDDTALRARIDGALADLLAKQNGGGGFGLWGPETGGSLWLDAFATEFLIRARDKGFAVPAEALGRALDNLSNQIAYASDFSTGGEDIAYALYDLARGGRAAIGDLRYYFEAKLDAFATPLAKAQLGAALALYGDRKRTSTAFAAAIASLPTSEDRTVWRADYGSALRDTAAVLALAAEFRPEGVDLDALAQATGALMDQTPDRSTQEMGWILMAAAAVSGGPALSAVTLDGGALPAAMVMLDSDAIGAGVTLANAEALPVTVNLLTEGWPEQAPEATANGFGLVRDFYRPDGTLADLAGLRQNDRLVVALTVTPEAMGSGDYLVEDALPAGFEIENPNLSGGTGAEAFGWLGMTMPVHAEARTDRFVAAYHFTQPVASFTAAYLVRVTSPGQFALPGARVEDMYRPERQARGEGNRIDVAPLAP